MSAGPELVPAPPRLRTPRLGALAVADGSSLYDGDRRDAERFVGTNLSGRDLSHVTFSECELIRCRLDDTDLTGAHLVESVVVDLDVPGLTMPRSELRTVALQRSRIGSVEWYESRWTSVLVEETKLGFVNARGARWRDVVLRSCAVEELDLSGATLERVALENCRIGVLHVTGARLSDVDLRGAELREINGLGSLAGSTITSEQLLLFAPLLAKHVGLEVRDR